MRFTIGGSGQDRDVEVAEGSRLGDIRGPLSRLTGVPELADPLAVLAIGDLVVTDDHLCGQVPFEEGCILRVGRTGPDPASAALRSSWHLAVLSGPDSGALLAVEGPVTVGRGLGCDLAVDDPRLSRDHVTIRPRRARLLVRDIGSANGTERHRRTRSGRVRTRRLRASRRRPGGYRLHDGDRLAIGSTVVEVRSHDRREDPRGTSAPLPGPPAPPGSLLSPISMTTWLTPMITGVVLALSTGQRGLLLLALSGPAVAAVTSMSRWRATHGSHRGAPGTAVTMVSAADLATGVQRHLENHPQPGRVPAALLRDLVPDGCLAVLGSRELALGAARSLVLAALASPSASPGVDLRIGHPAVVTSDWDWCRWGTLPVGPATVGATAPAPLLVVDPVGGGWPGWLASWWHASAPGSQLMLIARGSAAVPTWCRSSLEVTEEGAVLRLPDGSEHPVPLMCVSRSRAQTLARQLAAVRGRQCDTETADGPTGTDSPGNRTGGGSTSGSIPARVVFDELPGVPTGPDDAAVARGIVARWSRGAAERGLSVPLGVGPEGKVVFVDLTADGPHALVAGTTGAGKSALLQTLVTGLTLVRSPADLALALIDYKGGASFGAGARLPHVVGQVTDLDPVMAMRALTGLRSELRRRERLCAAAGVTTFDELRTQLRLRSGGTALTAQTTSDAPPPRLVVVVDEFRALADELPDFLPALLRVAAQGRSLGMHLVLATQRPGGAVSADMRANIALRIALRVTDATDSHDILGLPGAAAISADTPGRAILRRGSGPGELVQVAYMGRGTPVRTAEDLVRPAAPWAPWTPTRTGAGEPSRDIECASARAGDDDSVADTLDRHVRRIELAAAMSDLPRPAAPWLPDLPLRLSAAELAGHEAGGAPSESALPFALADVPETQRRTVVHLQAAGGLLIVGGSGSGRSTALHTLAAAALERGWHVHLVGLPAARATELAGHPGLGTCVDGTDPRRLTRLLRLLMSGPATSTSTLLLVDGLDEVLDVLQATGRGQGRSMIGTLLRASTARNLTIAATSSPTLVTAVQSGFPERLVLAVRDPSVQQVLGVPRGFVGSRPPGRGVLLGGGSADEARMCQVAVVDAPPGPSEAVEGGRRPLRLMPLPFHAGRPPRVAGPGVGVGLGGDEAQGVRLDVSGGALVVGPPGSGRSSTLAILVLGGRDLDRRESGQNSCPAEATDTMVLTADGSPLPGSGVHPIGRTATWSFSPEDLRAVTATLQRRARPALLVIDDLDDLEARRPAELTLLLAALAGATAPAARGALIASARTARVCASFREPWTSLRTSRRGVVLSPLEPGSSEVFGTPLDEHGDAALPSHPGRGVVQDGRQVQPVQVYDIGP